MDSIGSILPRVLKRRGMYPHVVASIAVSTTTNWLKAHLPGQSDMLAVKELSRGTLHIIAENSVALMACNGQKEILLAFLQQEMPEARITEIRISR